jgi:hypothetical protein
MCRRSQRQSRDPGRLSIVSVPVPRALSFLSRIWSTLPQRSYTSTGFLLTSPILLSMKAAFPPSRHPSQHESASDSTHHIRREGPRHGRHQPSPERSEGIARNHALIYSRVLVLVKTLQLGFCDPHDGRRGRRSSSSRRVGDGYT